MDHKETTRQVKLAQAGRLEAFNWIVRQFQDLATGYAASVLGDFQSAQDAAQDAFVEAYLSLPSLRSPEAFPAWLRKIVFKHCDRQTRRHRVDTVPITAAEHLTSALSLEEMVQQQEVWETISRMIQSLPAAQREVVTLFYIGQNSQQDIAEFLGLSVTTVKSRLHQGRGHLRERIMQMDKSIQAHPARDEAFVARVNRDITIALAAQAAETEVPMSYDDPHPMYHLMSGLMGSILLWAVEVNAAEIHLVPDAEQVVVHFTIAGVQETVLALPKSLQEAIALRFKVAGDMAIGPAEEPQEGLMPILHKEILYEAIITVFETEQGEQVGIALAALPKQH